MMLLPSLLQHTVGAKTGKARTTSVTYARNGGDYLVVATNGGGAQSPGWYHNLKPNPDIEINAGRKRLAVIAHSAARRPRPRAAAEGRHQAQQILRRMSQEDPATIPDRQVDTKVLTGCDC